jgi:hypothetical protein
MIEPVGVQRFELSPYWGCFARGAEHEGNAPESGRGLLEQVNPFAAQ